MSKKNIAAGLLCTAIVASAAFGLAGCGNMDIMAMHYNMGYIVLKENDHDVLHKVKSWADSDSEAVTFRCEHCGNYVWGSVNNANLYENRPPEYAYDFECTELGE